MLQITKNSIRAIYYDDIRDDYFYKDTDELVPENMRTGFHNSVFKKSSHNPDAKHCNNEELLAKMARLKIKMI